MGVLFGVLWLVRLLFEIAVFHLDVAWVALGCVGLRWVALVCLGEGRARRERPSSITSSVKLGELR